MSQIFQVDFQIIIILDISFPASIRAQPSESLPNRAAVSQLGDAPCTGSSISLCPEHRVSQKYCEQNLGDNLLSVSNPNIISMQRSEGIAVDPSAAMANDTIYQVNKILLDPVIFLRSVCFVDFIYNV